MAITKVMGIETEYGITVPGAPDSNPVLASSLLVNAFSGRGRKVRWDYEEESPLRDARGFEAAREPETPAEDDLGLANVDPDQRGPLLRRPRPPRVLLARVPRPAHPGRLRQGGGADPGRVGPAGGRAGPGRPPHPGLQEQHRRQGHLLRHPRELPGRPGDPVRPDRPRPDPVPGQPPGVRRRGQPGPRPPRRLGGLPDRPAQPVLRGRGRPGDDPQAADRQHPRRAPRRPRALPAPARDHRRRQHERGGHLPQDRGRWPSSST